MNPIIKLDEEHSDDNIAKAMYINYNADRVWSRQALTVFKNGTIQYANLVYDYENKNYGDDWIDIRTETSHISLLKTMLLLEHRPDLIKELDENGFFDNPYFTVHELKNCGTQVHTTKEDIVVNTI